MSRGQLRSGFNVLVGFIALVAMKAEVQSVNALHLPTNDDLRHIRSLNDPRLSPDGHAVLFRVTDATADGGKSHLWLTDIEGHAARQLTYSPDSDKSGENHGEWMPDGESIMFLAHRGEHVQLFRLPMKGGEAKALDIKIMPAADDSKLSNALPPSIGKTPDEKPEPLPADIRNFEIAPDGKTIAVVVNDPETPGEKKQKEAKADAKFVDHETHGYRLYLVDAATEKVKPVPLAPNVMRVKWNQDSTRLVAITEEQNGASDLRPAASTWIVRANDIEHSEKLTELPATISIAQWADNGQAIVFLAQARADAPPGYLDLYEYNLTSRTTRDLTDGVTGSLGFAEPSALADGGIVTEIGRGFGVSLARVTPGNTKPKMISGPAPVVSSATTNAARNGWIFLAAGSNQPPALFYMPKLVQTPRALKTPELMPQNLDSIAAKHLEWKNGTRIVEGLLYLPPQSKDGKIPLVVQVHGGPLGAFVENYSPWVNLLAAQGWAVLQVNPRGSTNYGAAFAAANKNDLGGGDYQDIMSGVDYAIKTEPIDGNRLALEGYSYGGEMAGFVEGKTTRFKAIVSGAPVIDQFSEYGTEGDSWYDRWYYGKPWEHSEDAWRQSPLAGVKNAKTPFLLLQGEEDKTDPLGQSQEMYRALRQMNVPVELVTYPREDHGPLGRALYGYPTTEPWHGFDARRRVIEFIKKGFGDEAK